MVRIHNQNNITKRKRLSHKTAVFYFHPFRSFIYHECKTLFCVINELRKNAKKE